MMYKRIKLIILACCLYIYMFAQNAGKNIAPFKIDMANGKQFTYQQLKRNSPVILIYFSPKCEHCKAFTKELLQHEKQLMSKQIVMVTYLPVSDLKTFVSDFNLNRYPNITVGTEGYSFVVQKYYQVRHFPFVAIYSTPTQLEKILPYSENNIETVSQIVKL